MSLGRHGAIQIWWRMVCANARQIKRKNCVVSRQFADIHAPAEGTAKQAVKENHGRSRTGLKIFDFLALDFCCLICSLHSFPLPFRFGQPNPYSRFQIECYRLYCFRLRDLSKRVPHFFIGYSSQDRKFL